MAIGTWLSTLQRIARHRWHDARESRAAIPPDMAARLSQRIAASEGRHTGEIRICVEAGLPLSYLRRRAHARERAVTLFGKLRVWDTEHNNGVLIYLLLAEHAIEIVADRAVARAVPPQQWQQLVARLSTALRESRFEDGLTEALQAVSVLLVTHFPAPAGVVRRNELPDAVVLL
ncbi:MAG TPA: TPM domain-containing protein [Burkholderiaceae bacterium]